MAKASRSRMLRILATIIMKTIGGYQNPEDKLEKLRVKIKVRLYHI